VITDRLNDYFQRKGLTYYRVENDLKVSTGSISGAVKHQRSIGSNVIEKILLTYPDLSCEWLLRGEGKMLKNERIELQEPTEKYLLRTDNTLQLQAVPLYNLEATAGLVELFHHLNEKTPIDFLSIPNLPKCDGAVFVTGDSMYPLLKSGDIVIYKQVNNIADGIFWGEMYLVSIDLDGEEYIAVKYVQKSDLGEDYVKLVSQNGHHQPKDVEKSRIRAIALVKASVRINTMG